MIPETFQFPFAIIIINILAATEKKGNAIMEMKNKPSKTCASELFEGLPVLLTRTMKPQEFYHKNHMRWVNLELTA